MRDKQIPYFWLGLFFGLLFGVFGTLVLTAKDTSETYDSYRERRSGGWSQGPTRRPANPTRPGTGQQAEAPMADPARAERSFAKSHFMKKFVAALTTPPENMAPQTAYVPLLKAPQNPIQCTGCHDPAKVNVQAMIQADPGSEKVEKFRHSPRFMVPLMTKWVARLNQDHAGRLIKPVVCTDCHLIDPRDNETKVRVFPALMNSFMTALIEKPKNKQPASRWKPLLKDPKPGALTCAKCHGSTGEAMWQRVQSGQYNLVAPDKFRNNKEFMVHLMEEWVEELNHEAKDQLTKTVGCKDCHETDPRR
jgi:hypothetical protein